MTPDSEGRLKDKMERAALHDLMPDFDQEQVWQQLSGGLQPEKKRIALPMRKYAAAILVLCLSGLLLWRYAGSDGPVVADNSPMPGGRDVIVRSAIADTAGLAKVFVRDSVPEPKEVAAAAKKNVAPHKSDNNVHGYTANDIHNRTPCPIEVRISQMISCPDHQPRAVSSSSRLEPDQSVPLNYKEHNAVARNCSLTVKEIEIKSIATGEVILLNSQSVPATAQDVFSYITGERKGAVIAGVLNYDCDKKTRRHSLSVSNSGGDLSIE